MIPNLRRDGSFQINLSPMQAAGYGEKDREYFARTLNSICLGTGNEEAVGRAIRTSGIPREDIFVTTKMRHVVPLKVSINLTNLQQEESSLCSRGL